MFRRRPLVYVDRAVLLWVVRRGHVHRPKMHACLLREDLWPRWLRRDVRILRDGAGLQYRDSTMQRVLRSELLRRHMRP